MLLHVEIHVPYLYLIIFFLSENLNLPAKLKLCIGARVMLTDSISVSGRLTNSSVGVVKHLDRRSKQLCSTIYLKSDDPKASDSLKDRRLRGELKECVPITARAKRFPLKEKVLLMLKESSFC